MAFVYKNRSLYKARNPFVNKQQLCVYVLLCTANPICLGHINHEVHSYYLTILKTFASVSLVDYDMQLVYLKLNSVDWNMNRKRFTDI
jgi:hypothetical protein